MNRQYLVLLLAIAFWVAPVRGESAPALRQVATVALPNVEGRIDHLAYDGRSGLLYVAALGNNTVEVIDTKAGKVVHTIAGLREPQGVGLAAAAGKLYVANARDGSCRVYDVNSYRELGSIDLKDDADNVRYDSQAARIYVGYGGGALAVIDAERASHLADVKLPAHPESFQLEKSGRRIFVNLPEADGTIAVIDRQKRAVVQTWHPEGAKANFPMALNEAGHQLFVGCRKPAKLLVIDTNTGKTVDAQDCVGDTDDVWYDAASSRVYVSGGEGFVSVFARGEDGRLKPLAKVPTASGARTSLFSAETGMLCVAVPHRGRQPAEIRVYATK
jgi:YVTN family beta-propeller protein